MKHRMYLTLSLFALVAIIFALLKPVYVEIPPERLAASRLYFATLDARNAVTRNIKQSSTVTSSGKGLAYPSIYDQKHGQLVWIISENGKIVGSNKKYNQTLTFTPSIKKNKVIWSCVLKPKEHAPKICKL